MCVIFLIKSAQTTDIASKQNLVKLLCKELSVKSLTTIKYPFFTVSSSAISQIKYFSKFYIYNSFVTVEGMNSTMGNPGLTRKTIVIINEVVLTKSVATLISKNEKNEFRFLWLAWIKSEKSVRMFEQLYIPYNVQFFALKNDFEENVELTEFYHPRMYSKRIFKTIFGKLIQGKKLEILQNDFYGRRLDMNDTVLTVIKQSEVYMGSFNSKKSIVCQSWR